MGALLAVADNKPELEIIRRIHQEATRNSKVLDLWVAEDPSQPNRNRPSKRGGVAVKKISTWAMRSVEKTTAG
jgi:hypothetical protein